MTLSIQIEPHPLLDPIMFFCRWPQPMAGLCTPETILQLLAFPNEKAPIIPGPTTQKDVRDLLRHGGFKPSGRGKPASEYLLKAVETGRISPATSINAAVDTCNVVSLHSGLPVSVVDTTLAKPEYLLKTCPDKTSYVFNPSGQTIDISGLLALHDAGGPCGGPVKDSQRTKTHDETVETLTVIWGTKSDPERTQKTGKWYHDLLNQLDVEVIPVGT